jgi:hypothetical protein
MGGDNDLEFFGVTIKCKSAHLAALLNSSVTEDVVVVGKRAVDALGADVWGGEPEAEPKNEAEERDELLSMICEAN